MQKKYKNKMKYVSLEYNAPYSIGYTIDKKNAVLLKANKPLLYIKNPDFVIQVEKNEFVFTTENCDKSVDKKSRNVTFQHITLEKGYPEVLYEQVRNIDNLYNFPLKRIGTRFLIPSDDTQKSDFIYDAEKKYDIHSLLGMEEIVKFEKVIIEGTPYFQIIDQVFIGEDTFGNTEYETLIALLRKEENFPTVIFSHSKNILIPLQTKDDYENIYHYIEDRKTEYNTKVQVQKIKQREGIRLLLNHKD